MPAVRRGAVANGGKRGSRPQPYLIPSFQQGKTVLARLVKKAIASSGGTAGLDAALELAVKNAAAMTLSGAQKACPVDTGRLRASLNMTQRGAMFWTVGTNVEYARYVEFGTMDYSTRNKS